MRVTRIREHGANVKGAACTRKRVSRNVYEHERHGFTSSYDARVRITKLRGLTRGRAREDNILETERNDWNDIPGGLKKISGGHRSVPRSGSELTGIIVSG